MAARKADLWVEMKAMKRVAWLAFAMVGRLVEKMDAQMAAKKAA